MSNIQEINFYLKDGKIKVFPSKRKKVTLVLDYLINKFEKSKEYSEKEINNIINDNHSFNNPLLLRRELIDNRYLLRTPDGRVYWRPK